MLFLIYKKQMLIAALFFVSLLGGSVCSSDDDGRKVVNTFCLEAEFGLEEYLMIADITAESAPTASLLFKSRATMEVLEVDGVVVEKFNCRPKILSDDRVKRVPGAIQDYGPFGRIEKWERLTVNGITVDLLDKSGLTQVKPNLSQPVSPILRRLSTVCIKPFDWPLQNPSSFLDTLGYRDLYKIEFGADRKCIHMEEREGVIVTHWIKPSPEVIAVSVFAFKEDLPVSYDLYLFRKPINVNSYDIKDSKRLIRTSTVWGQSGGTPVPRTVVSQSSGESGLLLTATLEIYTKGDERFAEQKRKCIELKKAVAETVK